MTRIVVCADDYGFTAGVSRGIRELIALRAISATSVMSGCEAWPEEAPALKAALAQAADGVEIGLHLTLTDQRAVGSMPTFAPDGQFPKMMDVYSAALKGGLPLAEIEAEAERQIARFEEHFGEPPAYIDGHHHIQQLPGVRDIVVRLAKRLSVDGRTCWVRNGWERPDRVVRRGVAAGKALAIGMLGRGIRSRALAAGVATNSGFSGAYDFIGDKRPVAELFRRFIAGVGRNHLVFCHPGYADEALAARDIMTTAREAELRFLSSPEWSAMLARGGLEVGPLLRGA